LAGKVALITGAGTGIGAAIARRFAAEGAAVMINHRGAVDAAAATTVADEIAQLGGAADTVQGDVGRVADCYRIVAATVARFGRLDLLLNNAGHGSPLKPLTEVTEAEWDGVLATNLKGTFFCTQAAARQMIAQGNGGRVINTSSIHQSLAMPLHTPYCASKGGIRMLARTLGLELAAHGISVVNIAPGAIATAGNQQLRRDPLRYAQLLSCIPLKRMGEAEEVAALAAWLASDEAAYLNATTCYIDGGMTVDSWHFVPSHPDRV